KLREAFARGRTSGSTEMSAFDSIILLFTNVLLVQGFMFDSMAHMRDLVVLEKNLEDNLQAFITSHEDTYGRIKDLAELIHNGTRVAKVQGSHYLDSPINAYALIKRFTEGWSRLESLLKLGKQYDDLMETLKQSNATIPAKDERDVIGAITAILRLQNTYNLTAESVIEGRIPAPEVVKFRNNEIHYRHMVERGAELTEGQIDAQNEYNIAKTFMNSTYVRLCQGKPVKLIKKKNKNRLKCWYHGRRHPWLLLKPAKLEQINLEPQIYIFRDFITDKQADRIKEIATPKLSRATVFNMDTGKLEKADYRVAKSAWLTDSLDKVVAQVNRRASLVTGLDYGCAEHLQVRQHSTAQHSTAQHSTAQHSTAQHSTAQHSTAQHSTAQHSTARHGTARHGTARHGTARTHGTARHGTARHGTARHGTARHGTARHGTARHGTARHGTARHGTARHGTARHGTARHGTARHGTARHGTARHGHGTARHGTARHGTARHGTARHGTARHGTARHGTARHGTARHGTARHGTARHGTARHGTARHGTARHGTARHGTARHGTARHGTARHGTARHGTARHGTARHGTARHGTARHGTAHGTAQHSTAQHSTAQHSTAQHSTAQHSTAQHSTAQHSTAQHSTAQQVGNYGMGGQYETHVDFGDAGTPISKDAKGNRIATLLIYLNEVASGGATVFLDAGVQVRPSKGDAAFWYNLKRSGDGDYTTSHAGCPVLCGNKWVNTNYFILGQLAV
ncbi:hypothetical protein QZH41_016283, partial [Actinostola sp. cb2023]